MSISDEDIARLFPDEKPSDLPKLSEQFLKVEAISQKGKDSIAVSAIVRVDLRPNFQLLGAALGRGTHDRRGAFCPDRLH
jgi:hypothetical protein